MNILGIESTCDETGVALVRDGLEILANHIATSVEVQKKWGGVIPEIAAREQIKVIIPLIRETLRKRNISDVDAIAVAYGPGLIGSLLVGVETAKSLAYAWGKPLIGVNHLVGHIYSNWLESNYKSETPNSKEPKFPLIALVVSGGHTDLILMKKHGHFELLGSTLDDAAGEAFDKVARFLGLGYPGGPEIERVSKEFKVDASQIIKFPRPLINSRDFNFSFSGLKTAVVNYVSKTGGIKNVDITQVAHYFQEAIVDVLVSKTIKAARQFSAKCVVVGGGVAANARLRSEFIVHGSLVQVPVFFPQKVFSVDNGAMIASAAYFQKNVVDPLKLSADSGLHF